MLTCFVIYVCRGRRSRRPAGLSLTRRQKHASCIKLEREESGRSHHGKAKRRIGGTEPEGVVDQGSRSMAREEKRSVSDEWKEGIVTGGRGGLGGGGAGLVPLPRFKVQYRGVIARIWKSDDGTGTNTGSTCRPWQIQASGTCAASYGHRAARAATVEVRGTRYCVSSYPNTSLSWGRVVTRKHQQTAAVTDEEHQDRRALWGKRARTRHGQRGRKTRRSERQEIRKTRRCRWTPGRVDGWLCRLVSAGAPWLAGRLAGLAWLDGRSVGC